MLQIASRKCGGKGAPGAVTKSDGSSSWAATQLIRSSTYFGAETAVGFV